ncbi:hypothetical protein K2173_025477 [Erythroxylum novogranatense]|uniref:Cupin type-1 domain-containing protein n=1 Tax=Erythroxylum novogranatense TaxID=1862640 RepID=A0AAV8SBL5_9ROSI|nr:hypothetical protein K2173_025477 [Erythroxylum novogranatense]
MATKLKLPVAFLLLSLVILSAGLALATKDPELKQCQHQCKHQRQYGPGRRRMQERVEEEEERGGRDEWSIMVDPKRDQLVCVDWCLRRWGRGQQRALRRLECKTRYRSEDEEEEEEGETGNPYVFETGISPQESRPNMEELMFSKSSPEIQASSWNRKLSHWDADGVLFFIGRGTITMIREGKRESFNVEHGDIVRVPAGTLVYLINGDQNDYVINFLSPVNIPGEYEAFHGPGGEDPESFYSAFSSKLLEAALKGSIAGPFNSKTTKISFVIDGDGYLEMACPHVSSSRRRRQEAGGGQTYQKISSRLRRGTVFVVPAGHPVALVSSENKNLKNVINEMEKEAKELAFGVAAREVEQVFGNQNEELFFPGPSSWQESRAYA